MLVSEAHAIVLSGGSAFGLASADGVVRYLEEHGIGFDAVVARVPVVPAAALFDLWIGDASVRPSADAGYAACVAAAAGEVAEGNVGAGAGATVGKWAGPSLATKGGLGYASVREDELIVACVAAVNAYGDVLAEDGSVLAGARVAPGVPPVAQPAWPNTTLACVVTNATLSKEDAYRVARMAAGGLARAIRPVYTMFDGDVVFALATGRCVAGADRVGALAATVTADAIRRGVLFATSIDGVPACNDRRAG
jgi:L-aminopeptidase/D-esterase-like protein